MDAADRKQFAAEADAVVKKVERATLEVPAQERARAGAGRIQIGRYAGDDFSVSPFVC